MKVDRSELALLSPRRRRLNCPSAHSDKCTRTHRTGSTTTTLSICASRFRFLRTLHNLAFLSLSSFRFVLYAHSRRPQNLHKLIIVFSQSTCTIVDVDGRRRHLMSSFSPFWRLVIRLLSGLDVRILSETHVDEAKKMLCEVYYREQRWIPEDGNPSGLRIHNGKYGDEFERQSSCIGLQRNTKGTGRGVSNAE